MEGFDVTETGGGGVADDDARVSFPLGGPIYVPNLVGALTCIPEFDANALRLLHELEVELESGMVSSSVCDVDLSVADLKILSEEELVEKALAAAFKDNDVRGCPLQSRESNFDEREVTIENVVSTFSSEHGDTEKSIRSPRRKRKVDNYTNERRRRSTMEDDSVGDNIEAASSMKPGETNLRNIVVCQTFMVGFMKIDHLRNFRFRIKL